MAIDAATVWEIRSTATAGNVNGGGFRTGASGTDYSQQDAAQYALTSVTSAGAGDTFLTASAAADMVGNICRVVSGTNFTTGWYEIISVSAGVSVTVDRQVTTGVGASGVINIGGALSLGSTLDDDFFEVPVGGNKVWIKAGTYTLGESIVVGALNSLLNPIIIEGYNTTRGDSPVGNDRPLIAAGSRIINFGAARYVKNIGFEYTGSSNFVTVGFRAQMENCRVYVSSTSQISALVTGQNSFVKDCEIISLRGNAVNMAGSFSVLSGCVIHDSNRGIAFSSSTAAYAEDCVVYACVESAVAGQMQSNHSLNNCIIFGEENNVGIGVNLHAGSQNFMIMNTIIAGFATGVNAVDWPMPYYDNNNNYYNNTADVSNWVKGPNSIALDPEFADVTQITGTGATTGGSDNILTDATKDFTALGVVAGRDFVYLVSGTNTTVGKYGITSVGTTTLTLDLDPSSSSTGSDIVYQITLARDFTPGANMSGVGTPGLLSPLDSVGYPDIGAVQRQPGGSGGGGMKLIGSGGLI